MNETVNTREFIKEVKERPSLWNCKDDDYNNKQQRRSCWTELCYKFSPSFPHLSEAEQSEVERNLQRKWRSLRSSFVRELGLQKKDTKGNNRKKYVYYEQLLFLKDCVENRTPTTNIFVYPAEDEYYSDEKPPLRKKSRRSVNSSKNKSFLDKLQEATNSGYSDDSNEEVILKQEEEDEEEEREGEEAPPNLESVLLEEPRIIEQDSSLNELDEDRLFLLSLVTSLRQVPEERKLDVKLAMMHCIKTGRESANGIL